MALYRQGDVLLVRVDGVPGSTSAVAREEGRLVLAHGEVTGHAHAIEDPHAKLVTDDGTQDMYLLVHDEPATLEHDEHDPITLPEGVYRVVRQREYTLEQIRAVLD